MGGFVGVFCPQCGESVEIDEDGCCTMCGATATGEAVEAIVARLALLEEVGRDHIGNVIGHPPGRRELQLRTISIVCEVCRALLYGIDIDDAYPEVCAPRPQKDQQEPPYRSKKG